MTNIRASMPRTVANPTPAGARTRKNPGRLTLAARLYGLWAFAVAQPVLDLIGREPDFLIAHRLSGLQLLLLALGLALLVPTVLAAPLLVPGSTESRFARVWTDCFSALFGAAFLLQLVGWLPGSAAVAAASAGGIGLTFCLNRYRLVSHLVALTAAAALIAPIMFLARPAVRGMLTAPSGGGFEIVPSIADAPAFESDLPIVLVVFDELPTSSLQRPDGSINEYRFPAFAALASESDWYRRAVTVGVQTTRAVPSILTGQLPVRGPVASHTDHPANLFTWLATSGGYRVVADEEFTRLCPPVICTEQTTIGFWRRLAATADDLSVVYGHLLLPESLAAELPDIEQTWSGFRDRGRPEENTPEALSGRGRGLDHNAPLVVADFLKRIESPRKDAPTFHYLHLNLPHVPWKYLPSGVEYTPVGSSVLPPGFGHFVPANPQLVIQGWRRHLLQVGYADRVLRQIVERLKSTGVYDHALLVVTSDHGRSFRPGELGRAASEGNVEDLLEVPLFVKTPGQRQGAGFEHTVQTTDIVPTIAAALGVQPPWEVDGRRLRDPEPRTVTACCYPSGAETRVFQTDGRRRQETLDRLYDLFGDGAPSTADGIDAAMSGTDPFDDVFAAGPSRNLLGRVVADLTEGSPETDAPGVGRVSLYGASAWDNVRPGTNFVPSLISGRIEPRIADGTPIAVSVDGVVRATTSTFTERNVSLFSALVPERWLPEGSHRIDAFTIESAGRRDILRPLPGRDRSPRLVVVQGEVRALELPGEPPLAGTSTLYESHVEVASGGIRGTLISRPGGRPPDEYFVFDGAELVFRGEDDELRRRTWQMPIGQAGLSFRLFMPAASAGAEDRLRVLVRSGDQVQDVSPSTRLPGTFELARDAEGRARALLRRPAGLENAPARRIPIARDNGLAAFLEGALPTGNAISAWAADLQDPGSKLEIVVFLGDRELWVGQTGLEREDVAAQRGDGHLYSGVLLSPGNSAVLDGKAEDRIRREGLVVYAVAPRGVASRLRFSYRRIERGRAGVEIIPVSDGRRLVVRKPDDRVGGAVDLVTQPARRTLIEGWAADIERGQRPRQIVVYRGDEHVATLGINRERPDVASHLENGRLLRTGFRGVVPGAPDPAAFAATHRVFALMLSGVAVDLPIADAAEPWGEP